MLVYHLFCALTDIVHNISHLLSIGKLGQERHAAIFDTSTRKQSNLGLSIERRMSGHQIDNSHRIIEILDVHGQVTGGIRRASENFLDRLGYKLGDRQKFLIGYTRTRLPDILDFGLQNARYARLSVRYALDMKLTTCLYDGSL